MNRYGFGFLAMVVGGAMLAGCSSQQAMSTSAHATASSAPQLPSLTVTNAAGATVPNPNFNCTALCINPFSGLYLGANGAPLTLNDFRVGRLDKDFAKTNFAGLGDPSAGAATGGTVTPRVIQLAIRFRW